MQRQQQSSLKDRTANNKDSFLLSPYPLDDLIRALRQRGPRRIRRRNSV